MTYFTKEAPSRPKTKATRSPTAPPSTAHRRIPCRSTPPKPRPTTIDYVVTDQSGLTATSTRTVIIQPANDNQASSTPANDKAVPTTTAATSTS